MHSYCLPKQQENRDSSRQTCVLSLNVNRTLRPSPLPLPSLPLLWRKYLLPQIQPFLLTRRQHRLLGIAERERQDLADPRAQHFEGKKRFPVSQREADTASVDGDHTGVHLEEEKKIMSDPQEERVRIRSRLNTYLERGVSAEQCECNVLHSTRLMSVVVAIARLHDVVIRQPFERRLGTLIHGCRVQRHSLVV